MELAVLGKKAAGLITRKSKRIGNLNNLNNQEILQITLQNNQGFKRIIWVGGGGDYKCSKPKIGKLGRILQTNYKLKQKSNNMKTKINKKESAATADIQQHCRIAYLYTSILA